MNNNSIDLKGNDNFSLFNEIDLKDLKNSLNSYYIEYRDQLNLDNNITFGTEIETEYAEKRFIDDELRLFYNNKRWKKDIDNSLVKGTEIKSPILYDKTKFWNDLKLVCEILQKYSRIDNKAAAHIHIGSQILGNKIESWYNFSYLWGVYENIIYRFSGGSGCPICRSHSNSSAASEDRIVYSFTSPSARRRQVTAPHSSVRQIRLPESSSSSSVSTAGCP